MDTEPIRLTGYPALAVGLLLLAAIGWAGGLDLRAIVGQLATVALTSIGGLEFARSRIDSPRTSRDLVRLARMSGYQQGTADTRELEQTVDDTGGARIDLLLDAAAIGMVVLLAWSLGEWLAPAVADLFRVVVG